MSYYNVTSSSGTLLAGQNVEFSSSSQLASVLFHLTLQIILMME